MLIAAVVETGCLLPFDSVLLDRTGECRDETTCGAVSCCSRAAVPAVTFDRGYDMSDRATQPDAGTVVGWQGHDVAKATLSAFELDVFEVTNSRFRAFVAGYDAWRASGHPAAGEGANRYLAQSGWVEAWSTELPATGALLSTAVDCDDGWWSATAGARETMPMTCVSWFEAFAYCIWEGGRLPTEAEWNAAAAGGDEQRAFPWSSPAGALSIALGDAVYGGVAPETVGNRSVDTARWGHRDLGGNVREWVLDYSPDEPFTYVGTAAPPCADCANLTASDARIRRGGAYDTDATRARSAYRSSNSPESREVQLGFRCAR